MGNEVSEDGLYAGLTGAGLLRGSDEVPEVHAVDVGDAQHHTECMDADGGCVWSSPWGPLPSTPFAQGTLANTGLRESPHPWLSGGVRHGGPVPSQSQPSTRTQSLARVRCRRRAAGRRG